MFCHVSVPHSFFLQIIFHCVGMPYLFTLKLINVWVVSPVFGIYEQCRREHSWGTNCFWTSTLPVRLQCCSASDLEQLAQGNSCASTVPGPSFCISHECCSGFLLKELGLWKWVVAQWKWMCQNELHGLCVQVRGMKGEDVERDGRQDKMAPDISRI